MAKDIWTATYALATGGVAFLVLGALHGWLGHDREQKPTHVRIAIEVFGRQALVAYILAHVLSDVSIFVLRWTTDTGTTGSLHTLIYRELLTSWLPDVAASLAYSLLVLLVVWLVVAGLDRRGFRLRL